MEAGKDGVLIAYIENFYKAENDHDRTMIGAMIVGYLECLIGLHVKEVEENKEEPPDTSRR